jgi:hypothetical protein
MALPVILVDSASGSDAAASGAGPSTALSGTANASTSGTGLVVTLPSGTVLTGVSTTGSDVIFINDATAGARNFGKITATSGSGGATPTVTVADAFGLSLSGKSWAIGGKRASIGSTTSGKLFSNNGGNGDWMPGWAVEMQSGHAETLAGTLDTRRAGDTTSGGMILRGVAGAATRPVLTFSGGGNLIVPRGIYQTFRGFDIKDTSGHLGTCFVCTVSNYTTVDDVRAEDATSYPSAFANVGSVGMKFRRCRARTAGKAIVATSAPLTIEGCDLHDCGNSAIDTTGADPLGIVVEGNLIRACAGPGIVIDLGNGPSNRSIRVARNTVDGCTGASSDGIQVKGTVSDVLGNVVIEDNLCTNNARYGINFATPTDGQLAAYAPPVRNNGTYNNTSGAYNSATAGYAYNACPWASGDPGVNPSYTSGSDWTPTNTAVQVASSVAGYP